jgi:glycoside/pentoside/hexuronide:cation symporter, GPH family
MASTKELRKKAYISQEEYDALQQPFSKASIKNYIGMACVAESYDGPLSLMFQMFLTFVYTEYLGISAISMAAVVSASVIIDGITDLLMGMVTDRVRSKYGKMRHWFLWMALPLAVVGIMCWTPPTTSSELVKLVYVFIVYNVFCSLMTCVRIPGAASFTLCTDSDKVRGNLAWVVSIVTTFCSLAVQWLINPMLNVFGGGFAAYRMISIIFAVFTFVMLNIGFFLTRETRYDGDWAEKDKEFMAAHKKEKRENILEQYGYLLKNKWWVVLMLSKIAGGLMMGFSMALQAYFLQYVLGSMAWMGLLGSVKIAMIIGSVISVAVIKYIDARTLSIILYAVKAVALICAYIFGDNVYVLFAFSCLSMFTDGLIQPANSIIISRVVDYGEWKNGIRQEGLCNSGQSVMGRIGNAVATAVMGVVLSAFGYTGAGTVTAACTSAIRFMYLGVPAICSVLTLFIFMLMKLDGKTVEGYRKEIAARHSAENA